MNKIIELEMGLWNLLMGIFTLGIGVKRNSMEKGFIFLAIAKDMKGIWYRIKEKDKGSSFILMEVFIQGVGKITVKMAKEV